MKRTNSADKPINFEMRPMNSAETLMPSELRQMKPWNKSLSIQKKIPTKAERNAERLRAHLQANVKVVNADDSSWGSPAQIVEVQDEVATLFSPAGFSSASAFAVRAHCDDLEIVEGA